MFCRIIETPLGRMLAAAEDGALRGLWFEGQAHFPKEANAWTPDPGQPVLAAASAWLDAYFAGADPGPPPPLEPAGTPFQKRVWDELARIPRGRTDTYGAIAGRLGSSARAVGGAVGRNPLSVLVPCHRAVGRDGALTGYAGGVERKRALLELEAHGA